MECENQEGSQHIPGVVRLLPGKGGQISPMAWFSAPYLF